MDALELLGTSAGLGLLAGVRLYATVLAVGLAIRFQWVDFGGSGLNVLAHPAVLVAAGILCLIELLADKIVWLDSAWDAVHTFVRPVGAALLGLTAFTSVAPEYKLILALITGGFAFTSHASKAATRVAINHSPEPFSNIAVSLLEDAVVPVGLWVVFQHPLVALGGVALFLGMFLWMWRVIARALRRRRTHAA